MLLNLKVFLLQLPAKFWFWWAWRLPKKLVYFAAIRLVAFATQGEYDNTVVSELPAMEAIGRWGRGLTKRAADGATWESLGAGNDDNEPNQAYGADE